MAFDHHSFFLPSMAGAFVLAALLTSCNGYERLEINPEPVETREFYLSEREQIEFEEFCLSVFQEELEDGSTLDLHYTLIHPEQYEIEHKEAALGSYSLEEMIKNHNDIKELREELLEHNRNTLTAKQQITYDALLETLETQLMAHGLELYEQPLAPTIGVQAQLPILLAEYAFHSAKDVEDYLALVEQIDEYYSEILKFESQKADAGLAPSDETIDGIIESCRGYLPNVSQTANRCFLAETFADRLEKLAAKTTITNMQKEQWIARHNKAIAEHFLPAYELLIDGMTKLKGRSINDNGLAGFQDGKKYYEYLVKSGSGTSYTVPELKSALISRMNGDMIQLNKLYTKYPDLDKLVADAQFALTDPEEILKDLQAQSAADFPALPACDYEINYVPASLEDILSPAFYLTAPLDNTDQNVIYINNAYSDSANTLYTTLAHEGFPGHLYQTIYSRTAQQESPLLSILSCSGANEGWATYVEHYANFYDNGLPECVGQYFAHVRSYSLCVHGLLDIGIHYEGWDRETADRFVSSCFQVDKATLDELWQTILDNPTNYLDYCGGFVEIMEMREEAESLLGPMFSAMDFHTFLLDIGPVPFSVIRRHFDDWLKMQTT